MHLRRLTPFVFLAGISVALPAQADDPVQGLSRDLRAAARGEPLPPGFRAPRHLPTLENGVRGRRAAEQRAALPDDEYGVLFRYDGQRSDLEAAGLRVVTQAGNVFTARARATEIPRLGSVRGIRDATLARPVEPHLDVSLVDIRANLEHNRSGSPPVFAGHAGKGVYIGFVDRKSTRLNSSHIQKSRMPSSA